MSGVMPQLIDVAPPPWLVRASFTIHTLTASYTVELQEGEGPAEVVELACPVPRVVCPTVWRVAVGPGLDPLFAGDFGRDEIAASNHFADLCQTLSELRARGRLP
jgi:hypothetical protein